MNFENYVKELGEMLKKKDWKELDKFVKKHARFYGRAYVSMWENATNKVKKLTYCNMVMERTDMDKETIEYAKKLKAEIYDVK